MRFDDFAVGKVFTASFAITEGDFKNYLAFARTRNILNENPELAAREGIKGVLLPIPEDEFYKVGFPASGGVELMFNTL